MSLKQVVHLPNRLKNAMSIYKIRIIFFFWQNSTTHLTLLFIYLQKFCNKDFAINARLNSFLKHDYLEMVNKGFIEIGQKVDLCIPTGNFGSILSAIYAKSMDVPYDRVICASNDNKILHDFLETGIYGVVHQIKNRILKLQILNFTWNWAGSFFQWAEN